jgi:tetratricopeptide (TPR) repeat protein
LGSLQIKITNYDKALAIDPHFVLALTNKGLALADLGNDTGAIIYYDKALAIDPKNTFALDNKGAALGNLGNHTGAIIYYDKALAIDPKYENGRSAKYRNPCGFPHIGKTNEPFYRYI